MIISPGKEQRNFRYDIVANNLSSNPNVCKVEMNKKIEFILMILSLGLFVLIII